MAQVLAQNLVNKLSESKNVCDVPALEASSLPISLAITVSVDESDPITVTSSDSSQLELRDSASDAGGSTSSPSPSPSSPTLHFPTRKTSTPVYGKLLTPKDAPTDPHYIPKIRIKLVSPKASSQSGSQNNSGTHPKLRQLLFNSSTSSSLSNIDFLESRRLSPRKAANRMNVLNRLNSRSGYKSTGGTVNLESPDSPITQCNIRGLVNKATFAALPLSCQYKLLRLLPDCDVLAEGASSMRIHPSALNNEFFTNALQEFRERLSRGEFRPATGSRLQAAAAAAADTSSTDAWKKAYFEDYWGQRQTRTNKVDTEEETDDDDHLLLSPSRRKHARCDNGQETAASVAGAAGGLLAAAAQAMEQASAAVEAAAVVAAAAEASAVSVSSTTPPATPPSPDCSSIASSSPSEEQTPSPALQLPEAKPASLPTPPTDDDTPTFVKPKGVPPASRGKPGGKPPLRTVVAGKPAASNLGRPPSIGKPSPPCTPTSRLLIKRTANGELTSLLAQKQGSSLLSMVPSASPTPTGNRQTRTLATMREKIRAKRLQNEACRAAAATVLGGIARGASASSTSSGSDPASPASVSGCSSSCDSSPLASPQLPSSSLDTVTSPPAATTTSSTEPSYSICRSMLSSSPQSQTASASPTPAPQMYLIQTQTQRGDGTPTGETQSILVYSSPGAGGQLQLLAAPAAATIQLQQQLAAAAAVKTPE